MNLLSVQTLVESPFVIVKIGDYTFGSCARVEDRSRFGTTLKVTFPNYMQSISIVKVNGQVNTYTIGMVYQITQNDDPNMLEKVFSSVSGTRQITISYGDWASPAFIYKNEEAIITKVQSTVDFGGSKINYTISAVSGSVALKSNYFDFPKRNAKPSDVIKELLMNNQTYQLKNIFYGMKDNALVKKYNLIPGNDKQVIIESKQHVSVLDYLNYLVSCMSPSYENAKTNVLVAPTYKNEKAVANIDDKYLKSYKYYLGIYDDTSGILNGPYFKIVETNANAKVISPDTFEVDVGYPGNTFVTNFQLRDNEQWSILYNYSQNILKNDYIYKINNDGEIDANYSPELLSSGKLKTITEAQRNWWNAVTQFPITATLTIKGLMRPSILMSYVKINVLFYGKKYLASGTYIITRQQDTINAQGYRTELTLTRVQGDDI